MSSTSGTFTGTGNSTLGIDVNINGAASAADRLTVGGALTGQHPGAAELHRDTGAYVRLDFRQWRSRYIGDGTDHLVQPVNVGLVRYDVAFNGTDNTFALVGTPGDAVARSALLHTRHFVAPWQSSGLALFVEKVW